MLITGRTLRLPIYFLSLKEPMKVVISMDPGTEKSDSIPALLSDGEFVFTADAVRGAGNGDRRQGARKMYNMMRTI